MASEASAVTLESIDTAFEIDTDPGETPFDQTVEPGADPAEGSTTLPQDWAGEGNQAAPGLTIHTDLNYTPLPEVPAEDPTAPPVVPDPVVPDDLTVEGIKADCAETQDDISNLDEPQMVAADPVMAGEPTTPAGDLSDLCQVLHAHQGAPNTNGTIDQIIYLGASFLGDGEQVDSYTLWYELNQYDVPVDGVATDTRYRTEDDILIGFDYRGPHAGTVRGYRFTADRKWAATTLVEDVHFTASAPADVAFAEAAINLTSSQLLPRLTGDNAITFRSARAMSSVLDQADPVEGEEYTPLAPSAPDAAIAADVLELSALESTLTNIPESQGGQPQAITPPTTMSIAIRKVSQPAGGTGFAFTSTAFPTAFTLDHGGTQTFRNLFPGSYTFTEAANADYKLAAINCVGTSGDRVTTSLVDGSVTVNGAAGEAITCVFTNQAPSSLTIVKQTAPANAAPIFEFNAPSLGEPVFGLSDDDSLTFGDLEPGTYSVTEADAGDWLLNPVTCVGATSSTVTRLGRGVSVNLAAGEDVICTFLNIRTDVPLLTVVKDVINNDGGTLAPSDVTLNVSGVGSVEHGVAVPTEVGTTYTVSEAPVAGYQQTGILCVDTVTGLAVGNGATFTAATDVDVTCTITNNDIAPTVTVQKVVVNNNGGTLQAADFELTLSGAGATDAVTHNQAVTVEAGIAYTVGEQNIPAAYTQQSINCVVGATTVGANGVLTLRPGQDAVCTVVNNDIGPRLTVNADIVNDHGGTATAADLTLSITPGATGDIEVADPQFGVLYELTEGATYTVSLADPLALGYDFVSIACVNGDGAPVGVTQGNGDVTVTVSVASAITCTVNVDDLPSFITLVKDVTNDDGGTLTPQDFNLLLDGATPPVYAQPVQVNAGAHAVAEDLAGNIAYDMTRIECTDNADVAGRILNDNTGALTVTLNQNVTCTVFNDDVAPRVTVNKTVINDNGGTLLAGDFELTYTGPGNTVVPMLNGIPSPLVAGTTYTVSETDPTSVGYRLVTAEFTCVDQTNAPVGQLVGTGMQITPVVGQSITCAMVNDDIPATVSVEKSVNSVAGGNELPGDFTLLLDDGEVANLATVNVLPGTHTVSEAPFTGYTLDSVVCVDAANPNNQVDVDGVFDVVLGQNIECIVSNTDVAPTLTLVKVVTNDDGGNLTADDFSFSLAGLQTAAFAVDGTTIVSLDSNTAYTLTEVNPLPLGYAATNTICESDLAGSANTVSTVNNAPVALNFAEGENVTCVIVNNDLAPSLTIKIAVDNADGGQATPASFLPTTNGNDVAEGVRNEVLANTDYLVGYTLLPGYQFEGVTCVDEATNGNVANSFTGNVTVQVQNAQSVVCTISVTDIAPTVVLVKDISLFDNGGTALASAFQLQLEGANVAQGATTAVDANQPVTIGEVPVLGYAINSITCSDGVNVTNGEIALALAQNVTCTVFNEDVPPTLTITKTVTNDNGGTATVATFPLSLTSSEGTVDLTSGAAPIQLSTGVTYTVGEASPTALGYAVQSFVCSDQNNTSLANATTPTVSFSVVLGQQVSCTVVNNDIAATVTVNKVVTNNDGGNDTAASFTYQLDGTAVAAAASTNVLPGAHTVTESVNAGYVNEGIVCRDAANPTTVISVNGAFDATLGQQITCTITNNDIAPTLTLIKEVTNNSGGALVESDFDFSVGGITAPFVAGAAGATVTLAANAQLTLTELNATSQGYNLTGTVCVSDVAGSANTRTGLINADVPLNLAEGEDVVCTMSNNDAAATLTVIKNPVVDNGGVAAPGDFPLTISPALPDGQTLATGAPVEVNQGVAYTIGENLAAVPGYARTSTVCVDNTTDATVATAGAGQNVVVTLAARQLVTCTITNDDIAPTLTFVKNVINDNGGTLVAADFPLQVNGTSWNPALGAQTVRAGVPLNLTETTQTGYVNQGVVCTDVTNGSTTGTPVAGATVTLALDQDMSCVITNNDIAPTLTITKTVTNDSGGTLTVADFPLTATSNAGNLALTSGAAPVAARAGVSYTVGEANPAAQGYTVQSFVCTDQSNATVANATTPTVALTMTLGQQVSCVLVNNDIAATVTVNKVVTNNNGGNDTVTSFTYQLDGTTVAAAASTNVLPGSHTVTESANAGYVNEGIVCSEAANPTGTIGANGTFDATLGQQITCTITNNDIAPTVRIVKNVTNDSGGTLGAGDFDFSIGGVTAPFVADVAGTTLTFAANTPLTLTELNATSQGYNLTSTSCVSDVAGSINTRSGLINADVPLNLVEGEDVVCTMTNNDAAATLTVIKTPIGLDGGTAVAGDFPLTITPALPNGGTLTTGLAVEVNQGVAYTIGENLAAVPGYARTSTVCVDNATDATVASAGAGQNVVVTLAARQVVTCTITNDDIAPTLTFTKNVINDNGGTAVAGDFALQVNGTTWNPVLGAQAVRAGVPLTLTEAAQAGYANEGVVCTDVTNGSTTGTPVAGAVITLALDQDMSCVITNNDIAPTLTITKTVTNDNGGTLTVADFPLSATSTAGNLALTSGAAAVATLAGVSYTVGEANPAGQGYAVQSFVCTDQNNATLANTSTPTVAISLTLGQQVSCALVNNDIAATVSVNKVVTNNNGGNDTVASFTYQLDGTPVAAGATTNVLPGTHTVTESANAGYVNEGIVCRDAANPTGTVGTNGSFTATLGQQITCTITNNDIAPTVRIVKTVTNDSGGTRTATGFTYDLSGQSGPFVAGATGVTLTVAANAALVLSEVDPVPLGYNLTSTVCTSDVAGSANIRTGGINAAVPLNLVEGEDVVCTMTNNDAAATLTVVKAVANSAADGGTALPADFPLTITPALPNAGTLTTGVAVEVNQGVAYTIGENLAAVPGYANAGTTCVDVNSGNAVVATATAGNPVTVTLAPRQVVTCTITNNDIPPTLTFSKNVINDNGGTAVAADFALRVNGNPWNPALGAQNVTAGVPMALGEVAVAGYTNTGIVCTDITDPANPGAPTTVTSITLALDQDMRCVITNDDTAPTLTLTKTIVNTGGGTITSPAAFTLAVNGTTFPQGVAQVVPANTNLTITETPVAGYQLESIVCTADGNVNVPVTAGVINIGLGQVVSCVVTNGDIDPTLALTKTVVNDNGGNAAAADFSLLVNGTAQAQGPAVARTAGVAYTLSEAPVAGYTLTGVTCTGGTLVNNNNGTYTLTLALGNVVSCAFTNNDVAPQITLVKNAVLDSSVQGATVNAALFGLTVAPTTASPTGGTFATGAVVSVPANATITVGEVAPTALGFALTGIECVQGATVVGTGGTLTLNEGQNVTCTVTNNDIAPVLNVRKAVAPEFASLIALNAFTLTVTDGLTQTTYPGSGGQRTLVAGAQYTVGETAIPAGWELVGISCVNDAAPGTVLSTDGTITLGRGETGTCTVTNRPVNPTVTINKVFINDSQAGTPTSPNPAIFGLRLTSGATVTNVTSGQTVVLTAGQSYTVSEDLTDPDLAATGYAFQAVACSVGGTPLAGGGTFTAQPGQVITCNVVNNDIAPVITLNKVVVTNNGGNDAPGTFQLTLTPVGGATANVVQGAQNTVLANQAYTISEVDRPGYTRTNIACIGGTVSPAGVITPLLGQTISCTVTNDDQPATIRVLKTVVGGNLAGSPATFAPFITLNGAPVTLGAVVNVPTTNGPSFTVAEDQDAATALGYVNTAINCVDQFGTPAGTDGANVVPTEGQNITCTVVNTFITPTLIITKSFEPDWNPQGEAAGSFGYTLNGGTVQAEEAIALDVDTLYTVAENDPGTLGYETVGISCFDSNGALISQANGALAEFILTTTTIVTCDVVNRAMPAQVFVTKSLIADDPGTVTESSFTYIVNGETLPFGDTALVPANQQIDVEEIIPGDLSGQWATDSISCSDRNTGLPVASVSGSSLVSIPSLDEGQVVDCEIINVMQPPSLSVFFDSIIDNGGIVPLGGFSAVATQLSPVGPAILVADGGSVTTAASQVWEISISPIAAQWALFAIDCFDEFGNSANLGGLTVTIPATGGDVQCSIVVDDIPGAAPAPLVAPLVEEPLPGDVPPAEQPPVDPQPPVDGPVVDPQPPVDEPVVDPQPPVDPPADEPVVDQPVVDPQPPVDPPADEPVVDPQPPVDPVIDPVVVPEVPLPQDPEGIVAVPEEQPTTQQPTDQPVPPVDPPAPPAEEPAPPAEAPPAAEPPADQPPA